MYKLKDIIASSGSNAKINKSIDRYVLSKKEKKDIIKNIKDISQNNNSSTAQHPFEERYYFDLSNIENKQELVDGLLSLDENASFETDVNVIIKGVIDNTILYSVDPVSASFVSGTAFYLKSSTYQLSIKKYIIIRSVGSGNISGSVATDIKYLLEQLQIDTIELFNNQITADQFWDSITIFEP